MALRHSAERVLSAAWLRGREGQVVAVRAAGPARTLRLDLAALDGSAVTEYDRARALTEGAALAAYRYEGYR